MFKWFRKMIASLAYAATHDPPDRDEIAFGTTTLEVAQSRRDVNRVHALIEDRRYLDAVHETRKTRDGGDVTGRVVTDSDAGSYAALIRIIAETAHRNHARDDLKVMLTDPEIVSVLTREQRQRFSAT